MKPDHSVIAMGTGMLVLLAGLLVMLLIRGAAVAGECLFIAGLAMLLGGVIAELHRRP